MNGYQFPGGAEADAEKAQEKPVKMGSEAYKRVWPDAIWPNALPSSVPLAVVVESEVPYRPNAPEGEPKLVFDNMPSEVGVISGGNFTDNISFFSEVAIEGGEVELEMAHIGFDNILPDNALSLKVGKIIPFVTPFSNMRRLTSRYWYASKPFGNNNWNFDRPQKGFEVRGLLGDARFIYSVGLVEGRQNVPNGDKDFYLHAGYKFGGLRLDGKIVEATAGASQPWQDNSVRLDAFFYNGRATLGEGVKDNFNQFGGSIDAYYERFNFSGLVAVQHDDRPLISQSGDGTGTHIMVEGTYVLYPWLLPNLRYERFRSSIGGAAATDQRFVPGLTALIRANLKAVLSAEIEKEAAEGEGEFEFGEIELALVVGF